MIKIQVFMMIAWATICAAQAEPPATQGLTENYGPVVAVILERGNAALAEYTPDDSVRVGNEFSRLYFDVFEGSGMEFTLNLKSEALRIHIESDFSLLISQSMRGAAKAELEKSWASLTVNLDEAVVHYSNGGKATGFWGRVIQSFLILFREGLEAMLVVAALVAYLRRSGYSDKVKIIWWGCGSALIASIGMAWLLNRVLHASGANREALEGATLLMAAAVLLYVSYWLTAKRSADRWQAFIKGKMDHALRGGSLFSLGLVAFLAVFREGAETILFYQALMAGSVDQMKAIWIGMGMAAVVLTVVYGLIRWASIRLPLGLFFGATALLLFFLAFVFAGQGMLELQVSGVVPTTRLDGWPMVSWLGLFPTLESVVSQGVILAMLPAGWLWMKGQKRRVSCASKFEKSES